VHWAFASDDWCAPSAENDLRVGGRFTTRMESKEGDEGFDFSGTYDEIIPNKRIAYTMDGDDARKVEITFEEMGNSTAVSVNFDPESENSVEMQRSGWQSILNNFRDYTEKLA
jgi:uncharacterized protein YndB with AHSA1/START domain